MKKTLFISIIGFLMIIQPVFIAGQGFPGANGSDPFSTMSKAFDASEQDWTPEDEYYIGRAVGANILAAYKAYTKNQDLTLYLNRICQTLVINSSRPEIFNGYHVLVLDSNEYNAFATPGGHIFVTRGLVESAISEDALAAIIAHEISHIILRHGLSIINDMKINEEMAAMAQQAAAFSGNRNQGAQRALAMRNSVAGIIDTMLKNGYSRPQEFEADNAAAALLAASGYDPNGLLDMLRVLQKVQQSQKGGFNSTHPDPGQRIANLGNPGSRYRVTDTKAFRTSRFKTK